MAGKNQVTLTFAGDTTKLETAFKNVGGAAKDMDTKVGEASSGFDVANDAADGAENKFQGLASSLEGTRDTAAGFATLAKGDLFGGLVQVGQGAADLAEGMAYTIIPALKFLSTQAIGAARTMVVSAARQVGAWIRLGVQAMIQAARIAAAWLISLGPIALVVAAVVGLVIVVVKNWTTIKNAITNAAKAVLGFLRRNWPLILGILTGPIGLAVVLIAKNWGKIKAGATAVKDWIVDKFNAVLSFIKGLPKKISSAASGMWDGIKNAFRGAINTIIGWWNNLSFTLPSVHIPGTPFNVGGFTLSTPNIGRLHGGGVVPGAPGSETLAMLQAGERVTPAGRGAVTVIEIRSGGSRVDDLLVDLLRNAIRVKGGSVQTVLGS
jgi:phage-related protein